MWRTPNWGWSSTREKTEISSRRIRQSLYVLLSVFYYTFTIPALWYYLSSKINLFMLALLPQEVKLWGHVHCGITRAGTSLVVTAWQILCNIPFLSPHQTREQEELEELLLLEQQSNEQRRLDVLQEEQRQLQAKRKSKQTLLDELVRHTHLVCPHVHRMPGMLMQNSMSH